MTCFRARALLCAIVLLVSPARTAAQWSASAGLRAARFWGGTVEPATGRSLRPYRPTMVEIEVDRVGPRVSAGLRLYHASSSLALEGDDALAAIKDALTVYGAEPEVSLRLAPVGSEGVLRLAAGPLFEIWKLPDVGSRMRVGFSAGLALELSLGGRWTGVARMGGAVTPSSPFMRADLDAGLEPRTLWRREVAGAVRYRL